MRTVARAFVRRGVVYGGLLTIICAVAGDGGIRTLSAQTGNPVAAENALPGNPDWDQLGTDATPNAGDPTIQGFATDISVNVGETVHFKINTPATEYRIDIYRIGYDGGAGARKVMTVFPSVTLPQTQPDRISDQGKIGRAACRGRG